jgi:hypothetical protein
MSNIIYLKIDGKETFAWVTELKCRLHNMFRVSFKNEYENIFFTDVETGKWIEEDLGFTVLAQEVGTQIIEFTKKIVHVPKLLVWHAHKNEGRNINFGFYSYLKGDQKMYEIYGSNRKYIYTLVDMNNDEWQILGNSPSLINQIDPLFIEQVINILNLYTEDYK